MTRRINYVGPADRRVVTREQIIGAGLTDPLVDLIWTKGNSYELDVPDATAAYLVGADGLFVDDAGMDFGDIIGGLTGVTLNPGNLLTLTPPAGDPPEVTMDVDQTVSTLLPALAFGAYAPGGYYFANPGASPGTLAMTLNQVYYIPFVVPACTIDRVGLEVTTVAGAGGVLRFSVHSTNGGLPGPKLSTDVTGDATILGATTPLDIAITGVTVAQASQLWLGVVAQVAAPTVRSTNQGFMQLRGGLAAANMQSSLVVQSLIQTGVTGTIPTNPAVGNGQSTGPRVYFRIAP